MGSRSNKGRGSMREEMGDSTGGQQTTFRLNDGLKRYLIATLGFNIFCNLLLAIGWWDYVSLSDSWDVAFTMVNIMLPGMAILFLVILDSGD